MPVPRRVVCCWVLVLSGVIAVQYRRGDAGSRNAGPRYQVDPWWPRPFTNQSWVLGSITGVTVDAQNHIWVVHRGGDSLETNEKGMMLTPPSASLCCQAAPPVLEFDQKGVLVSSWGGPGQGYAWPQSPGSLAVDAKGNVWITAAGLEAPPATPARGRGDAVVGEAPAAAPGARPRRAAAGSARRARPQVLTRRQVPAADRRAGQDGRPRQPDDAEPPVCGRLRRCRQRGVRRRHRQPPHRRLRCGQRRLQAALVCVRREGGRRGAGRVCAERSAGEVVPRRHVHRDRSRRAGLRLRSQQQPHPGVPQGRHVRQGRRRVEEHARRDRDRAVRRRVVARLGVGPGVLERRAAALRVRRQRPRQESAHPAARHAGAGRHIRQRRSLSGTVPRRRQHRRGRAGQRLYGRAASRQARAEVRRSGAEGS